VSSGRGTSSQISKIKRNGSKSTRTEALKNDLAQVAADTANLREALQTMSQFYYMRKDAQPVHGLQDWTERSWADHLAADPEAGAALAKQLLTQSQMSDGAASAAANDDILANMEKLAKELKQRLGEPLAAHEWRLVVEFQNRVLNQFHEEENSAKLHYLSPPLLSNMLFDREFPLGVEQSVLRDKYKFAVRHSGLHDVKHKANSAVTAVVYASLGFCTLFAFCYLGYQMSKDDLWGMADTVQDRSDPEWSTKMTMRNKSRGTAASLLSAISFSLTINGMLDKFGLIDPSSSTVFIGMTLGGTWGFVLDNMFGSDEGFREYLWSPQEGMRYAMGQLRSDRYARYIITILFDMFITVILFKLLFPKLVSLAGFTVKGREWIANGFVSATISILTFQVYANMTRFEWAYPSGTEHYINQWISGQTMVLNTIIMNMVYLVAETRSRVGEPGINDPHIKLCMTCFTMMVLWMLQSYGVVDPSVLVVRNVTVVADPTDVHLPLPNVCKMKARAAQGFLGFVGVTCFCLGFVIFGTSAQSLSGLKEMCGVTCKKQRAPTADSDADSSTRSEPDLRKSVMARNTVQVDNKGRSITLKPLREPNDRLKGQCALFAIFGSIIALIVLVFTFVPFYSYGGERNDAAWKDACEDYDVDALDQFGLS